MNTPVAAGTLTESELEKITEAQRIHKGHLTIPRRYVRVDIL